MWQHAPASSTSHSGEKDRHLLLALIVSVRSALLTTADHIPG
jgi:hypothetical protein